MWPWLLVGNVAVWRMYTSTVCTEMCVCAKCIAVFFIVKRFNGTEVGSLHHCPSHFAHWSFVYDTKLFQLCEDSLNSLI